jgi:RelE toxin of RelE / RelB toxin-antitoxin system
MQRPDRQLGIRPVDQDRNLDLRRGDGADVDAFVGERLEGGGGNAGVAARRWSHQLRSYAIDIRAPLAYVRIMLVSVVETDAYLSKAEKIMSAEERDSVVAMISARPTIGDLIPGAGGLRKVRIPLQGRGKRGGGRVIYWYYNEGYPAILMWAFAKNEASDLSAAQKKSLAAASELFTSQFRSVK